MAFRFSVDGQIYDIVEATQSGQIIHQQRVTFAYARDLDAFVDQLLEQNAAKVDELQRFLSLANNEPPREPLIERLDKGTYIIQKGSLAHMGGVGRAPTATAAQQADDQRRSSLYSNAMLSQMASINGDDGDAGGITGAAGSGSGVGGSSGAGGSGGSDSTLGSNPLSYNGSAGNYDSTQHSPATPKEQEQRFKICVEIAGRSRCFKQRLGINQINGGEQPGDRQQILHAQLDHKNRHRCLVEFKELPNTPRDLSLIISTKGAAQDIQLPLVTGHPTSDKRTEKPEWDTVLIPIKPLAYIDKTKDRQKADVLKPGYVYVFWKGQLWRELEVSSTQALRDVDVAFYRDNWNGDLGQTLTREADGHWLNDILVPYKLNGTDESSQLRILYSEIQLDFPYIESLESDSQKLDEKSTQLNGIEQYSSQQHFDISDGDVGAIQGALLDQNIDPASGYEVISKKGHHLNRARAQNIPVTYLVPVGEKFVLKVEDQEGNPITNKRITLEHDEGKLEGHTDAQGVLELILEDPISGGKLDLYLEENQVTHQLPFKAEQTALPDVSTVAGQQLRLNNLGYNAGVVDGINGRRTRTAARTFQKEETLQVDGIIGPQTQKHLKSTYGQ